MLLLCAGLARLLAGALRARTKVKRLKQLGIGHDDAMALGNRRKGAWRISRTPTMNFALPQSLFVRRKGLLLLG